MYFVSNQLVAQLNADAGLQAHFAQTVRSANDSRKERFLPWEDVFTGMALTQAASGQALASVHMHMALYAEGWQFASTPSVLLWHMKAKRPDRIGEIERWSAQQPSCVAQQVSLTCANLYTSCNGQSWLRCMSLHNRSACATKRARIAERSGGSERSRPSRQAACASQLCREILARTRSAEDRTRSNRPELALASATLAGAVQ